MGAQHFVLKEEEEAFADWINKRLAKDKDIMHFLPLEVSFIHNCPLMSLKCHFMSEHLNKDFYIYERLQDRYAKTKKQP